MRMLALRCLEARNLFILVCNRLRLCKRVRMLYVREFIQYRHRARRV